MNKISIFLSKISKKTKITILVITLIVLGITVLYQTFAISSNISGANDNYTVTLNNNSTVTVPANGKKTVYFKIRNNNKGTVKYGVGYKGTNITVKVYSNSESPSTGTITESESKFIKLKLKNTSTSPSAVELISILGYENGGDLIVPNGYTLVTSVCDETIDLAKHLTNLYTNAEREKTTVNSVTYNLASSVGLMNDRFGSMSTNIDAGNIRYYGKSPNNYIYFNCSDYNNQNDTTCEKWRIIGIVDGKIKIMRNEIIGKYSWDSSDSTVNEGYGVNDWSNADIMKLLNSGYENESIGGSLYWNAGKGDCYNNSKNGTTSCDFRSTGLNKTTRNLILEETYHTRGDNGYGQLFIDTMYDRERVSGTILNTTPPRSTTWKGNVALPYPSDYGYAADLSLCQKQLGSYDDATCTANNWMYNIYASSYGWLLFSSTNNTHDSWYAGVNGDIRIYYAFPARGVAPALYLLPKIEIELGNGTSSNPYQLDI